MSGSNNLTSAIMNLIQEHGGVSGIMQQFQQGGLGNVAQSWMGSGSNQSVNPEQLNNVLNPDQVDAAAAQSGLSVQDFLGQLAQHLPQTIDHLTPNGQVPSSNNSWMDAAMNFLRSRT